MAAFVPSPHVAASLYTRADRVASEVPGQYLGCEGTVLDVRRTDDLERFPSGIEIRVKLFDVPGIFSFDRGGLRRLPVTSITPERTAH